MVAYLAFGLVPAVPLVCAVARREAWPWRVALSHLRWVGPGLLSFGLVAAYLLWARGDGVFRASSDVGFQWTENYSVWWYPLGYGLLLPLAVPGVATLLRERSARGDLVVAWLGAAFMLSTNPIYAGVKCQYLLFPPMALCAALGLFHLLDSSPALGRLVARRALLVPVLGALCLNLPVAVFVDWPRAGKDPELFASHAELDAFAWLSLQPDGLVLCSHRTGTRLPWLSGKRVFLGHWFLTLQIKEKIARIGEALARSVPATRRADFLRQIGARWIFVGPWERSLAVDESLLLLKRYDRGGIVIYEVPPAT
jgi:hypothetical protein